jgi:hypothetical protein
VEETHATREITRWEVRTVLTEACPGLEEAFAQADADLDVGEDRLTYHEVSEAVRLMAEWFRGGLTDCFAALFGAFERCLLEGNDEAVELILVGVFEDLQNGNITEMDDFSVWEPFLHPVSARGWKAVVDFWNGDADALRRFRVHPPESG